MQMQIVINVDTTSGTAVSSFDTSASPLTVPVFTANGVPVAFYDGVKPVLATIEDRINDAILEALRAA